ncbi:TonB-dependent receptor, partial [candidate division KSB1 bacterium]|nr:TonB-dependent receptor [candidate division KSB1 bacterium]
MLKKLLFLTFIVLLPVTLFGATTGKIVGKVTDKESGEPLPGANVVIEGTLLGAATDAQGRFIILNVPVGTYSLKTRFIGYRDVTVQNIRVHAGLTTEVDFAMPSQILEGEAVTIVSVRPLVEKNATNTVRIKTAEEIQNLPVRGFRDVMSIEPGVVTVGQRIYVRGGRREEIATYIDGVYQNNPLTGRASGDVSNLAIEEVNYQAGGFNAEYGFANSGVVLTTTKSGKNSYNFSGEVITDSWLSQTDKNLGTFSYGYNIYNGSLSGPVPFTNNRVKFYVGLERRYMQDHTPSSYAYQHLKMDDEGNPLDADGNPITYYVADTSGAPVLVVDDAFPYDGVGTPGVTKRYQWDEQGPWPHKSSAQWLWNGNVTIDLKPLTIRLGGNSQREKRRDLAGFPPGSDFANTVIGAGIGYSIWNHENNPIQRNYRDSYHFKVTHTLSSRTFYTAQLNYFRDAFTRSSVMFGDKFWNVGDRDDVGQFGPEGDGIVNPYIDLHGSRPLEDLRSAGLFASYGTQPGEYWKQNWQFWGAKADIVHQIGRTHELKSGFEYRYNTYRQYQIGSYGGADLHSLAGQLASVSDDFTSKAAYQNRFVNQFGYDMFGNEIDGGGRNAAKHPIIAAVYLQDKIEMEDLVLNLGIRWDYFDPANDFIADLEHVTTYTTDDGTYELEEENFIPKETYSQISPRLGFSFPVTDQTVFHAQYGKFIQTPELQRLYSSTSQYAYSLSSGMFFTQENANLRPVRTTAYEVGFRQQMGVSAALDVTAYYKEIRDHVRLRNLDNAVPVPYATFLNEDYGTVKGLSFAFTLRRTNRVSMAANYTLQYASGTGSDANTWYNIAWQQGRTPTFVAPLDFDRRHVGSFNFDYRFADNDGPMIFGMRAFSNTGVNLLFSFGSGLSYTPVRVQTEVLPGTSGYYPIAQVGSAQGPWTYQLDMKMDKTFT